MTACSRNFANIDTKAQRIAARPAFTRTTSWRLSQSVGNVESADRGMIQSIGAR